MSLAVKRQEILKDIRKKSREDIRKHIRETILAKNNSTEYPLMSDFFANFSQCTHWELCQQSERLSELLEFEELTELDDQAHDEMVTDLYYLIHENIITMPYGVRFRKNESGYTAALVALTADCINTDQLAYWIEYMDDEAKDTMFYGINVQDETTERWVTDIRLYEFLLRNAQFMESAAFTLKDFLVLSEAITKKQIDQSFSYIQAALGRQVQRLDKNLSFLRVLTQIWIKIIYIYSKINIYIDKVKEMVHILKNILGNNLNILGRSQIMQDLNQLYELVRQDYLEDNFACQVLLLGCIQSKVMKNEQQSLKQDQQLFANCLFRLFHNNWRAKQLFNRGFHYSRKFYEMLHEFSMGYQTNPFYVKLLNIEAKELK